MALDMKIHRPESTQRLNILVYGVTGVGKTYLLGTGENYADTSPGLLIDIEGGTLTLADQPIDVVKPTNWKEMNEIYEFLRYDNDKYRAVYLDSLTELQRKLSLGILVGDYDPDEGYNDLGSTNTPTIKNWMETGGQIRKTMRAFHYLTYMPDEDKQLHVVFTALEKTTDDHIHPQLSGQLGVESGAFVDVLGRLSIVEEEIEDPETGEIETRDARYLVTQVRRDRRDREILAKNRGGRLGPGIWDPTMGDIVGAWLGEEDDGE